ncbi:MAG: sigma-70 family RNA polymerase sigma factor, partial [Muribaculaceae bacterium]|nr:sigma-70 family RNA polymerase sigma factor [Muribaculaceae bacterium]
MAFSTAIDEKKLIEDLQRESTAHKAFELLMRTFSEPLYWQIRKMVFNHDDADDLLQNVFIKAWNNIQNFRGDARLSTWLYKIAVNESINFLNREKNRQNISADSEDSSFLIDNLKADDYFDGDDLQQQLLAEIAKLPEKQRIVFNMKYFDEMKYEEMSDILGTSIGALKASYHHAVKKISKAFGIASLTGVVVLSALNARAVPASPEPVTYTQPDGSIIEFRHIGDENNHKIISVADGRELVFDADGFLRPLESVPSPCAVGDIPFGDSDTTGKYLMSGSHFPHIGSPRALVILVMYRDRFFSMEQPQEYYHRMLNEENYSINGATGSARDFFSENSSGAFTPQFDVYGPVLMDNPTKYYGANDNYGYDLHPEEIVIEALTKLDDTVDFSIYDTDEDGTIDNVYIFYAGIGEQDSYQPNVIWPHSANILDFDLPQKEFYFDGVLLNHYAMSNEINSKSGRPDGMGTFIHEFSHVLGIPDFYATTYTSAFTPGRFSTMDRAPYNNLGRTPAYYSIFERYTLNWAAPEPITESGYYTLDPIGDSNSGYIIPTERPDEFFILENRQFKGFDSYIPGHGLLLWHIDYVQEIWDSNVVNNTPRHQCVDIVEADNNPVDATRDGDTFPGKSDITVITTETKPA